MKLLQQIEGKVDFSFEDFKNKQNEYLTIIFELAKESLEDRKKSLELMEELLEINKNKSKAGERWIEVGKKLMTLYHQTVIINK